MQKDLVKDNATFKSHLKSGNNEDAFNIAAAWEEKFEFDDLLEESRMPYTVFENQVNQCTDVGCRVSLGMTVTGGCDDWLQLQRSLLGMKDWDRYYFKFARFGSIQGFVKENGTIMLAGVLTVSTQHAPPPPVPTQLAPDRFDRFDLRHMQGFGVEDTIDSFSLLDADMAVPLLFAAIALKALYEDGKTVQMAERFFKSTSKNTSLLTSGHYLCCSDMPGVSLRSPVKACGSQRFTSVLLCLALRFSMPHTLSTSRA